MCLPCMLHRHVSTAYVEVILLMFLNVPFCVLCVIALRVELGSVRNEVELSRVHHTEKLLFRVGKPPL